MLEYNKTATSDISLADVVVINFMIINRGIYAKTGSYNYRGRTGRQ